MVSPTPHPSLRRSALVAGMAATIAGGYALSTGAPPVSADAAADRVAAASVRAAVAAESRKIASTADGLAAAEARLAKLAAREEARRQEFLAAQDKLVLARVRLTKLEKRSDQAKSALGDTLAAAYRRGNPDLASTIVDANGIKDAIEQVEFEQRVHQQNANALEATRNAKGDAITQEKAMQAERTKFQKLAAAAASDRDEANNVRAALAQRQATQLAKRAGSQAKLKALQGRIRRQELAQIAEARRAAVAATGTGTATNTTNATAEAPRITGTSQADSVVAKVVSAANEIASTPYVWGGGHGGASGGYDCSGSISYALAAAGLLSSPLTSGGFMSWGLSGVGQRITVYANAGHAYMYVDGRRYDTSALRSGGTRWSSAARSNAGFVARHPAGL